MKTDLSKKWTAKMRTKAYVATRAVVNGKIALQAFTLIEMMVSIALFSIVMVTVASAYLQLLSLDRETRAVNDVSNNLNFVVDTMVRSIRTGTNYQCAGGTNCAYPSGNSTFAFKDDQLNKVTYSLSGGQIMECYDTGSGCTATAITDPRITVSVLEFYVTGVGTGSPNDVVQPFVTFVIKGTITVDPTHAPVAFSIQSSAIQRQIDI